MVAMPPKRGMSLPPSGWLSSRCIGSFPSSLCGRGNVRTRLPRESRSEMFTSSRFNVLWFRGRETGKPVPTRSGRASCARSSANARFTYDSAVLMRTPMISAASGTMRPVIRCVRFRIRSSTGARVGGNARVELRERMQERSGMRDAFRRARRCMQSRSGNAEFAHVAKAVHLGERERRRVERAFERDGILRVRRAAREHAFMRDERFVEEALAKFAGRYRADVAHHERRADLAANTREKRIGIVEAVVVERHDSEITPVSMPTPLLPIHSQRKPVGLCDHRERSMCTTSAARFIEKQRETRHEIRCADGFDDFASVLNESANSVDLIERGYVEQHGVLREKSLSIVAHSL